MHALILNQTFYPDVSATGQLMWDLAQHLDAHGHHVSAVTSRHAYGTNQEHELAYEKFGNIEIHRVGGTGFGKKHIIGRLADFASYYVAAAWQLQHMPEPDVILALTSPPMIATLAMLQKQFHKRKSGKRIRLVHHVMDLYPDAAIEAGVMSTGGLPTRVTQHLMSRTMDLSDAVIALGRDMKERLIDNYGYHARPERIHVIPPWADADLLSPIEKSENPLARELGLADTFNVVYSGNLGIAHDLETMVAAIQATTNDTGLQWVFIGGGKRFDRLRSHMEKEQWKHVRLLPFQDRSALNQSLNLADVHLVSQLPAFTGIVVPSKLFGIMAIGKPAVMVGPAEAECSRIIADHQAGFVVANGDATGLVKSLRQLKQDCELRRAMGIRSRQAFKTHYNRKVACDRIEALLCQN